jgi:hypothetical protein
MWSLQVLTTHDTHMLLMSRMINGQRISFNSPSNHSTRNLTPSNVNYQTLPSLGPILECEPQCLVEYSSVTYQHHESPTNNTWPQPEMGLSYQTIPKSTRTPPTEHASTIVRYYKTSMNHQPVMCSPQY